MDAASRSSFPARPVLGKTACAEAIAHALQRPILVAHYADVLNCYVGKHPEEYHPNLPRSPDE